MSTLCFTGMDRAEEAKLKLMFSDVNEWLGGTWHIVPEAQAQVLIVDLESIYGHMTWLKVHNSGKYVIAITTRDETDAEHVLRRPVTVESLVAALSAVNNKPSPAETKTSAAPADDAETRAPRVEAQAPRAQDAQEQPAFVPQDVQEQLPPVPPAPSPPTPSPAEPAQVAQPVATQRTTAQVRAREPVLWDYLLPGGLPSPSRLDIDGAPALIIDPRTDTYIGGQALKPYLPYCELGSLPANLWQPLSGADLNTYMSGANTAQPLARLRWLYSLVQGRGELAPGYNPTDKFRLTKWPKTEREYPRHLRIATTMMQTPGTPAEIAAKSDVSLADVNDFINASLDSGFAEPINAPPPTPDAGPKSGGLFGRFRNPRGS